MNIDVGYIDETNTYPRPFFKTGVTFVGVSLHCNSYKTNNNTWKLIPYQLYQGTSNDALKYSIKENNNKE